MNFKTASSVTVAILLIGFTSFANADVSHLAAAKAPETAAPPLSAPPVTEICLGCMCEALSGCNRTVKCNSDVCGLFQITWPYWADAGKPTLQGEDPSSPNAFENCAVDPYCAASAVQSYMAKHGQDCNNDGVINCYDHAALHELGAYGGCQKDLSVPYANGMIRCLKKGKPRFKVAVVFLDEQTPK